MTDRELVEHFLATRDEQTFKKIYRRHTSALYLLALRLTGGAEADAQDALQETWVRACRKFSGFKWNSKLRTWLSGILINCIREIRRKDKRKNEEELEEFVFSVNGVGPGQNIELEKIIENLPTGYRRVLVLHDIEGYTHEEISNFLEISIGTSKSQLYHARKSVKASLKRVDRKLTGS